MEPQFTYKARVVSVYDGDTITLDIDVGFGIWMHKQKFRLYGIDTPEVRGPERADGLRVRDWLREYLEGKAITVRTHKARQKGKYGRWLAEIFADGENINETLVAKGMAEPATY